MKHVQRLSFSLTELLVVIALLAILMSLVSPSLRRALESAKAVQCGNQLKSIGVAFALYAGDNNDYYPVAQIAQGSGLPNVPQGVGIEATSGACWDPKPFQISHLGNSAFIMNNNTTHRALGAAVGLYRDYLDSSKVWYCPTLESTFDEADQNESNWAIWSENYNNWEAPDKPSPKRTSTIGYYIVPSEEVIGTGETRTDALYDFWSGSKLVKGADNNWAYPGALRTSDAPDLTLVADLSLAWEGRGFGLSRHNHVYYNPRHNTKGRSAGDGGETSLLLNDGSVNFVELDTYRDIPTDFQDLAEDTYSIELGRIHRNYEDTYPKQYTPVLPDSAKPKEVTIPIFHGDVRKLYRGE